MPITLSTRLPTVTIIIITNAVYTQTLGNLLLLPVLISVISASIGKCEKSNARDKIPALNGFEQN